MSAESSNRKHHRFYPDDGTFAQIDRQIQGDFNPDMVALVVEASEKGCGLVILERDFQSLEDEFLVQIGKGHPTKAQLRWSDAIDEKVRRIGVEYTGN